MPERRQRIDSAPSGVDRRARPRTDRRRLVEDGVPPGSGTSISFWLPGVHQAPEFMLASPSG